MRHKPSEEKIKLLDPAIQDLVKQAIEDAEMKLGPYCAVDIVQGLRTIAEQDHLYALGRTIKNTGSRPGKPLGDIVTNAKGGQSFHNYGLAIDFAILYDKDKNGTFESLSWDMVADLDRDGESDWKEVVDSFIKLGFEWGGNWHSLKDNPHFQMIFGLSWQECFARAKEKNSPYVLV